MSPVGSPYTAYNLTKILIFNEEILYYQDQNVLNGTSLSFLMVFYHNGRDEGDDLLLKALKVRPPKIRKTNNLLLKQLL